LHLETSKGSVQAIQAYYLNNRNIPMAIAADTKEAKYTQGFSFQQDEASQSRSRQVVERSCTALMTLMQELFVQIEKQISEQLVAATCTVSQRSLLEQLAEIVRARAMMERVVITSVVCAFAELEDHARGHQDNCRAITHALAAIKEQARGSEDLMTLLEAGEKIAEANNSNRPLLLHLNAQWVVLFGLSGFRLRNSPLGPATLTASFVAGLCCIRASLATKRLLFRMFVQHLLARLSMLFNNIALRLEEEGIQISRAVSFEELDVGPIREVLQACRAIDEETMQANRKRMMDALSRQADFVAMSGDMTKTLEPFLKDGTVENYMNLLDKLATIKRELDPAFLRSEVHHRETMALMAIRQTIVEQLNERLAEKNLPISVSEFFSRQWPDVLFEVAVSQGVDSDAWVNTMQLQQQLLKSVSPVDSEVQRKDLSKLVPSLVKSLRDHLEQAGYVLAETNHFFTQLKQLHLANVQQKLETKDFLPWQPLPLDPWIPVEKVMVSDADRNFYEQVKVVVG